jgi:broad specificity phosphatase PhoE
MTHRVTFLAHAATARQRALEFPDDEGIEPLPVAVAEQVRVGLRTPGRVWRGPERRSAETAAQLGVSATAVDELRAWSMGRWAGRSVAEVATQEPQAFAAWRTDPGAVPPGGESLTELLHRVGGWLAQCTAETTRTLVIADPAVIRSAVVRALDAGPSTFWRLDIQPLSRAVIQLHSGEWRLRTLGLDLAD